MASKYSNSFSNVKHLLLDCSFDRRDVDRLVWKFDAFFIMTPANIINTMADGILRKVYFPLLNNHVSLKLIAS